jgi:hypothetical protein
VKFSDIFYLTFENPINHRIENYSLADLISPEDEKNLKEKTNIDNVIVRSWAKRSESTGTEESYLHNFDDECGYQQSEKTKTRLIIETTKEFFWLVR